MPERPRSFGDDNLNNCLRTVVLERKIQTACPRYGSSHALSPGRQRVPVHVFFTLLLTSIQAYLGWHSSLNPVQLAHDRLRGQAGHRGAGILPREVQHLSLRMLMIQHGPNPQDRPVLFTTHSFTFHLGASKKTTPRRSYDPEPERLLKRGSYDLCKLRIPQLVVYMAHIGIIKRIC